MEGCHGRRVHLLPQLLWKLIQLLQDRLYGSLSRHKALHKYQFYKEEYCGPCYKAFTTAHSCQNQQWLTYFWVANMRHPNPSCIDKSTPSLPVLWRPCGWHSWAAVPPDPLVSGCQRCSEHGLLCNAATVAAGSYSSSADLRSAPAVCSTWQQISKSMIYKHFVLISVFISY